MAEMLNPGSFLRTATSALKTNDITCMQSFCLHDCLHVQELRMHPAYSSSHHSFQHCQLCSEWTQQNLCGTRTVTLSRSWEESPQFLAWLSGWLSHPHTDNRKPDGSAIL